MAATGSPGDGVIRVRGRDGTGREVGVVVE